MTVEASTRVTRSAGSQKPPVKHQNEQYDDEVIEVVKQVKKPKNALAETTTATMTPSTKLSVGDSLPDIALLNHDGDSVRLHDLVKEKGAVLFFYPKANTPGCTTQACQYRDEYQEFVAKDFQVVGCSADSPKSQKSWRDKHGFPYPLLSDPEFQLISPLGAKKSPKGVIRGHVVVTKGGKIADIHIPIAPKASSTVAMAEICKL